MIGLRPERAQVRTRVGRSLRPDSSMKTMSRRRAWQFFLRAGQESRSDAEPGFSLTALALR